MIWYHHSQGEYRCDKCGIVRETHNAWTVFDGHYYKICGSCLAVEIANTDVAYAPLDVLDVPYDFVVVKGEPYSCGHQLEQKTWNDLGNPNDVCGEVAKYVRLSRKSDESRYVALCQQCFDATLVLEKLL